jgi:hypothetical protein
MLGAALDMQVLRGPPASHELLVEWAVRAGPYCSSCANGYFRKGKICALCDDSTRNVMYVKGAAQ